MSWRGPLLQEWLAAGSLGQGGANGVQFPFVSQYFPVPAARYDVQIVVAGRACETPATLAAPQVLPALGDGAHLTVAAVGAVQASSGDAKLEIVAFQDDATTTGDGASLRVVNAIPSIAALDVGTGSLTDGTFAPWVTGVPFGATGTQVASGGPVDPNGYMAVVPQSNLAFSAHKTGSANGNLATATLVSFDPRTVTTMVLINGQRGGRPPQFLVCTDDGPPLGAQSPCHVIPQ
jgi:hypothetical protein